MSMALRGFWIVLLLAVGAVVVGLVKPAVAAVSTNGEVVRATDSSVLHHSAPASFATSPANDLLAEPLSSKQIEAIKQSALDLNRELLLLEEALLFPASSQVMVFVSMDVGEFFALDAIKLKIDGKLVASYLYTPAQTNALYRGGYQRLFVGNVKAGDHKMTAFFTGLGPQNRPFQRATSLTFSKAQRANAIELRIIDSIEKQQPVFDSKQWLL
jgi:hypothetical protein